MTYEEIEYDDAGNIIGSHQVGARSPLSEYMGENAKGPADRPARRAPAPRAPCSPSRGRLARSRRRARQR